MTSYFIQWVYIYSITIFSFFDAQIVIDLSSGLLFLCFEPFLLSGIDVLSSHFAYSSPGISHFHLILLEMVLRNEDLGTRCAHCY